MRPLAALLCLAAAPAPAQEAEDFAHWAEGRPEVRRLLDHYAAECRQAAEGGVLTVQDEAAFVETDLDGDAGGAYGRDDAVLDMNHVWCSGALSLWSGSGGAPIHFVLDGTTSASWTGHRWDQVRMGAYYPSVILIARHGTACDGAGVSPCVQAVVAGDGAFWTVRFPQSGEE